MIKFKCVIVLFKRWCEKKTWENKKFIELKFLALFYYCHDTNVEGKNQLLSGFSLLLNLSGCLLGASGKQRALWTRIIRARLGSTNS